MSDPPPYLSRFVALKACNHDEPCIVGIGTLWSKRNAASLRVKMSKRSPKEASSTSLPGTVLTDVAREWIDKRKIRLVEQSTSARETIEVARVAIGADHGGFDMKESLKSVLGRAARDFHRLRHLFQGVPSTIRTSRTPWRSRWPSATRARASSSTAPASARPSPPTKSPGYARARATRRAGARNAREHNDINVLTLGLNAHAAREAPTRSSTSF